MADNEPTTAAGRALLGELSESPLPGARYAHHVVGLRVAAIEAEARAALRIELAEKVAALPEFGQTLRPPTLRSLVDRAAVLRLLRSDRD